MIPVPTAYRQLAYLLWSAVIGGLLLFAGLLSYFVVHERTLARMQVDGATDATAAIHATLLQQIFTDYDRFLQTLRALILRGEKAATLDGLLYQELSVQPGLLDLLILDREGTITHWTGHGIPPDVRDRTYFTAHLERPVDRAHLTQPMPSLVHAGRPFVAISRPVLDPNGAFHGVVVAIVSVDRLAEIFAPVERVKGATLVVGTADGLVLFRIPRTPDDSMASLPSLIDYHAGRIPMRREVVSSFDGRRRFVSVQRLDDFPLLVASTIDLTPGILAQRHRLSIAVLLFLLVATGLSTFAWLFQRQLWRRARTEAALLASEAQLRAIVDNEPECIKLVDADGLLLRMNAAGLAMVEADTESQVTGRPVIDLIAPEYRDAYADLHRRVIGGESAQLEYEVIGLKGGRCWLETHAVPMPDPGGVVHLAVTRDISERKRSEVSQRLAASVFTNSYEGILISDANNVIVDVNPAFVRITGYEREEVIGQSPRILRSNMQGPDFYARMWLALKDSDHWRGEIWNRRRNGEVYAEILAISVVRDPRGEVQHYIGVFTDITMMKAYEAELDRIAHFDMLTGLPNRRLLADRLHQAIARARRDGKPLAVCYLDLDGFKEVNDRFGHTAGDGLLVEITNRLQAALRAGDTLARLGGDEFVLLLADLSHTEELPMALGRVMQAIDRPVAMDGAPVCVSASIGVTLYPVDDADPDTLLRHADQAMYRAKESGRNRYHLFDAEQDRQMQARREHLHRLARALDEREFVLHYQPKVDLVSGDVLGAEALIRWQHPEHGLLSPAAFLHDVIGSELEVPVGEWVVESTLQQMERWKAAGLQLTVSVNISADHLLRGDFVEGLRTALARHPAIMPGELELEILETVALSDMERAVQVISGCLGMGVHFALDDFGTGYSSLSYFRDLPVEIVKIDQSFVRDMLDDPGDLGIVENVVRLARAFNRPVIAEGVETLEHGAALLGLGCRLGQGYGIARPMPADDLSGWIGRWLEEQAWVGLDCGASAPENLTLMVAAQSHRHWVDEFARCIEHPTADCLVALDSRQCRFGRWYHGSGVARFGGLSEFQAIDPLHEQVHALAVELLTMARDGRADGARSRLPELYVLRDRLLVLLDALVERVLKSGR